MSSSSKAVLGILAAASLFVALVNTSVFGSCTERAIKYEVVTVDDDTIFHSESYTKVPGEDGSRTVCKNFFGARLSDEVKLRPVNEVYVNGTKSLIGNAPVKFFQNDEPIYDDYEYSTPTYGSICNDGTWSPSTGQGTCSWHDGVDYYL